MVIILVDKKGSYRWYHSLKWKLFFSFTIIAFLPIMLFFYTIIRSVETYYKEDRKNKLSLSSSVIAGSIAKNNYLKDGADSNEFSDELDERSREGFYRIIVFDENLLAVQDTHNTYIGKTMLISEVIQALENNRGVTSIHDAERSVYSSSVILNEKAQKIGAVLLVSSIEDIYLQMYEIQMRLILFTVITIAALCVLVFFLSDYLIAPLKNVLSIVKKISEGHLNQRVTVKGHDEFSSLGEAFNDMTQKLEQVEKIREEFVSNVSHELKTPLSSIKVLTESILLEKDVPINMYVEFLQDINSEIDRMTYIVNDLLTLVKLDQRDIGLKVKETNLNIVVEDVLKRIYPIAEQKNIEVLYELVRNVSVDADEMKLSLAISNLVENGIKYTPENGTVKVIVDSDHQNAFITVQDTGIGIDEKYHNKVFNRFYRVDKTRNRETGGTGLGLAITHSTVLLHNGSIKIISKENEGTTFVVRIPIHYNS